MNVVLMEGKYVDIHLVKKEGKMKKIKISFFDIDGTILRFGKPDMTDRVKEALNRLQKNGVLICLATGRPLAVIPKFEGVKFDLTIAFNGSVCLAGDKVITNLVIPYEEVMTIINNATRMGRAVAIATKTKIVANGADEALREYFELASLKATPSPEFDEAVKEEVYQMMLGCERSEWDEVLEGTSKAKIAAWWDCAVDIIPDGSGKGNAIKKVLEHLGLSIDEAIAFGDGGNDADMLLAVGVGVAMGNAADSVKAVADEVCGSVDEDGIYYYLKEKGLI